MSNAVLEQSGTRKTSRSSQPVRPSKNATLSRETADILLRDVAFIWSEEFRQDLDAECRSVAAKVASGGERPPSGLPAHLASLCASDLLAVDEERALFRSMNYWRYRANCVRTSLDPESPDASMVADFHKYQSLANQARDRILRSNMRLVMSIVKKFVTPQLSFDDLLSDGVCSLMQAADKFDYSRGFRFSTYAYRAISRNAYRAVKAKHAESTRFVTDSQSPIEPVDEAGGSDQLDERVERLRTQLAELVNSLDRRERFIIRGRHALGGHHRVKTFQRLADSLSISKERARQLEQAAVAKLRRMASQMGLEDLAETVFA